MQNSLIAKSTIKINSPAAEVWEALTVPEKIKEYMFGTNVISKWKEESPIVWKGEWNGKQYEDKGVILKYKPFNLIEYSHFSPQSGLSDRPENYHKVTIELRKKDGYTEVLLSQNNNLTEAEREHSEKNWKTMLVGLKDFVEKNISIDERDDKAQGLLTEKPESKRDLENKTGSFREL